MKLGRLLSTYHTISCASQVVRIRMVKHFPTLRNPAEITVVIVCYRKEDVDVPI